MHDVRSSPDGQKMTLAYGASQRRGSRQTLKMGSSGPWQVKPDGAVVCTRPADFPVEQHTEFELMINVKIARQLGLAISAPLWQRADRLIE